MKNPLSIIFVMDTRLSREKTAILSRIITLLRQTFDVELVQENESSEEKILEKMQKKPPHLVLVPHYRYSTWTRIEGFLGGSRNSGPTFASYASEPIPFYQPWVGHTNRSIHLDLNGLAPNEALVLIRSLIHEKQRSGLKPLLEDKTFVYYENWYGSQGQGSRMDTLLNLSEVKEHWQSHTNSIRILLSAFWSLIYEEGPGKIELPPSSTAQTPKAYFQIAADASCLALRLYYYPTPHESIKDALRHFQSDVSMIATHPIQLLLKYADFLRVQVISENSEIEIVAGLFSSSTAEKNNHSKHTLWIDQISTQLIEAPPFATPSQQDPRLRPLINSSDVKAKIIAFRKKVSEPSHPIPKPKADKTDSASTDSASTTTASDIEGILELFQKRYFEARFEIHQLETRITTIQKEGASPEELKELNLKMEALIHREKAWIKKIMDTLQPFHTPKKKSE